VTRSPRYDTNVGRALPAIVAAAVLVTGVVRAGGPTPPVKLTKAAAQAITKEIEKGRAGAQTWLRTSPTSYLAAVARTDFGDRKTLTVGRAAGNDVRLDDASIVPHHLRITLDGDRFHVEAVDPAARFTANNVPTRDALLDPSAIQIGRYTLRLSHQRFPAVIVFDPRSPRVKEYKGLKYFPVDLSYRFELPLEPNPNADPIVIMSTLGHQRRAVKVGWFDFVIGSRGYRLEATRLLEPGIGEQDISVFFRDATSGRETYKIGRYLDVKALPDGRYLLDFNRAYNPACAYSPHYNCPIPPKANTLNVAIRAGELDSHYD
jgi:uncharacterized protein (DUF1684 family)